MLQGPVLDKPGIVQEIKDCRTLPQARELHSRIQPWLEKDVYLSNMVIHMYGKCRSPELARRVFDRIVHKTSFSWDLMLSAYARNGHMDEARRLFDRLPERNMVSSTAMLVAHARHGCLEDAKLVFDQMPERDLVSWTTMLDAYARNGQVESAREIFDGMPERDMVCWTSLQASYYQNGHIEEAKSVFDSMPEKDLVTWTAMVAAYAQNGYLTEAKDVFDSMAERNLVSWTLMLCIYSQRGNVRAAKCLFDQMPELDFIAWNSMLAAYAQNGYPEHALELFHEMNLLDMPEEICMICVLVACCRGGTLELGRSYYRSIINDYGLKPSKFHYTCLVDLFCRSKHMRAAEELILTQPFLPVPEDWRTLLGACTTHKSSEEIAARATKNLVGLDPGSGSSYVMLANVFGNDELEKAMKRKFKLRKPQQIYNF